MVHTRILKNQIVFWPGSRSAVLSRALEAFSRLHIEQKAADGSVAARIAGKLGKQVGNLLIRRLLGCGGRDRRAGLGGRTG